MLRKAEAFALLLLMLFMIERKDGGPLFWGNFFFRFPYCLQDLCVCAFICISSVF